MQNRTVRSKASHKAFRQTWVALDLDFAAALFAVMEAGAEVVVANTECTACVAVAVHHEQRKVQWRRAAVLEYMEAVTGLVSFGRSNSSPQSKPTHRAATRVATAIVNDPEADRRRRGGLKVLSNCEG